MSSQISFEKIIKLILKSFDFDFITNQTTFRQLNVEESVIQGLATIGCQKPLEFQSVVLPRLIGNSGNVYLAANSGAGKTLAVVIAMVNFVDTRINAPQVLCLLPTIEMAAQTRCLVNRIGTQKGVKVCLIDQNHIVGEYYRIQRKFFFHQ